MRSHRPRIRSHRLYIGSHIDVHIPNHVTENVKSYFWGVPEKLWGTRRIQGYPDKRENQENNTTFKKIGVPRSSRKTWKIRGVFHMCFIWFSYVLFVFHMILYVFQMFLYVFHMILYAFEMILQGFYDFEGCGRNFRACQILWKVRL